MEGQRPLSRRIVIVGPSCSGKTTLGAQLGELLSVPFVELDALFWKPNWEEPDPDEFRQKLLTAHAGDGWVTAGNYLRHTRDITWPRADLVLWLDFPLWLTTLRVLKRSWRRWRSGELLWGTNYENFWEQLMLWNTERSLIAYNISRHRRNQEVFVGLMAQVSADGRRFVRLRSRGEVRAFVATLEDRPNS